MPSCSIVRHSGESTVVTLQALIDDGKLELLQEMYRGWPFFSVTLDMIEMVGRELLQGPGACLQPLCRLFEERVKQFAQGHLPTVFRGPAWSALISDACWT